MWKIDAVTLGEIALRTLVVYLVMIVGLRMTGKRQIGQMTPFDLVVLLLLSNAVQNAMTGPDTTVSGGVVAAVTLLLANYAASALRLSHPVFRRILVGVPVVLVQNGDIQFQALQHERMTLEDLQANLREHQCTDVGDVVQATLEVDGEVSVVLTDKKTPGGYSRSKKRLVRHHKH